MTKKNIILFGGIFLVVALIAFGTYSFWIWESVTNKNIVFSTAGISDYIEYEAGDSHFVGSFQPYATFCESVSTTVSIRKKAEAEMVDLRASIYMDINSIGDNIAASNDVYWVITEGDSTVTCADGLSSGSVINSGTFYGVSPEDVIPLATNLEVTLVEKKYTVWIWVDSNGDSLSSLSGETVDTNIWTQVDMADADSSNSGEIDNANAPTCTLSASDTTITATISNTNELVYYGWNSSYSGDNSTTTTISEAGVYSYYMLDSTGKTGVCRGTVENMIGTTTQVCNHLEDGGGCYYNSSSYIVIGGSCTCKNGSSTGTQMTNGNCGSGRTCTCPTGYGIYNNSCTVSCSYGTLNGSYCKVYTSYSNTTTYSCSEGSTQLNDTYCWVAG